MTSAYGWAFTKPIRKIWYNLTLTSVSVAVAIFIGGLEVLGLISDRLDLDHGIWNIIRELNAHTDVLGYLVVAIFIASWLSSGLVYRLRGYDDLKARWILNGESFVYPACSP